MVTLGIENTMTSTLHLAFMGMPTGMEWIILLVLGLLIFGRRLPEVGRSLGRGIVEFKKGIRGIEDEIDDEASRSPQRISESSHSSRQELPKTDSTDRPYTASEGRQNDG
jgi:sec-independent protein translocase protein TatA